MEGGGDDDASVVVGAATVVEDVGDGDGEVVGIESSKSFSDFAKLITRESSDSQFTGAESID